MAERGGMDGKICLITGANSGIGKAAAEALAAQGARIVMVCRDAGRGEAARREIQARAGSDSVDLLLCDLASQADVRRLTGEIAAAYDHLDVLINNAGLVLSHRGETVDGLETTFAVNHLAPFLLTLGLLDLLKASAPSRVVTVSSALHSRGTIDFDDLQAEQRFGILRSYGQSKLANILFTTELARRLDGSGVTATVMHPGGVATRLGKGNSGLIGRAWGFFTTLGKPLLRSPAKGAETVVYLAAAPDPIEAGGYYVDNKLRQPSAKARDAELAARLWRVSAELTGIDVS